MAPASAMPHSIRRPSRMKRLSWLLPCLLWLTTPTWADERLVKPPVSVTWISPEKYRDIRSATGGQKSFEKKVFEALTYYFQDAAEHYLQKGQTLEISVIDLDLAGDVRINTSGQRIRILTSISSPAISLNYKLLEGETIVKSDKVWLTDLNYQSSAAGLGHRSPLVYERIMIQRWIQKTFHQ
ncbi:DUF3016 domain-containing protein [Photobacterium atrarenae]|uniref:DUF3016 domain-containing protein n=1 Tax=Photobacterium atrarenae TaxID=865757 RepID=A0ABY5GNZ3_9GAMM|nr:DUF3016 domain-containing protein [Photobacterium atrarenae]UTV30633.1 DUF3016 domain-containing protein [Photobacterium atrarenae]